jgi:CO/xanthine dehydrogenase FAD-binding subunit
MKFGRTAYDFNLVNIAVRLTFDAKRLCTDSRIFLGGVGRVPFRATSSENELKASEIDGRSISRAVEALGQFKALPQIHGDAEYKRDIAKVLLRECIKRASKRSLDVSGQ